MATEKHSDTDEKAAEASPDLAVSEQIRRALEMMKRVRTANIDQAEQALKESEGNRYILPEPIALRTSSA